MISAAYVRQMAQYNRWQNNQVAAFIEVMDEAALTQDRGAFFGSILGTLNHILFADTMWLRRFGFDVALPPKGDGTTTDLTANAADWTVARAAIDANLTRWAAGITDDVLNQPLTWHSAATGTDYTHNTALCVVGFINHQTHHRGQVHAMLTAAGSDAPVSDLVYMPEDA